MKTHSSLLINATSILIGGVVWVEAVINQEQGQGTRHRIVDYETASRYGEPFEAGMKKYGLPNMVFQWCTRELKEHAMRSYLRDCLGWKTRTFWTAIGIRADEVDRVSAKRLEHKFVYPLVDAGWTKDDVKRECASWPFDLDLKGEHYGNCTWCWKKSMRKLMTLANESPEVYDFPARTEKLYKYNGANAEEGRQMFRKHMTTVDIIEMAKTTDFEPYVDTDQLDFGFIQPSYDVFLDTGSSCGESCEIGADD